MVYKKKKTEFPPKVISEFDKLIANSKTLMSTTASPIGAAGLPPPQDIGFGGVVPHLLRQKDQDSEKRQAKAQELATSLAQQFQFLNKKKTKDAPKLYIRVCIASEGGRVARMFGSDRGSGHAKLLVHWVLYGRGKVWAAGRNHYTDGVSRGYADWRSSTVGEVALYKMADRYVTQLIQLLKLQRQRAHLDLL